LVFLHQRGTVAAASPPPSCWLINGSYASLFSGPRLGEAHPCHLPEPAFLSRMARGSLSGQETIDFNGMVCNFEISGTYTLASDGSGSNAINFFGGGPGCDGGSYSQGLSVATGSELALRSNTNAAISRPFNFNTAVLAMPTMLGDQLQTSAESEVTIRCSTAAR